jgi:hypothetical protein
MIKVISDSTCNTIRGKVLVGKATPAELLSVFARLDAVEELLEDAFFGEFDAVKSYWRKYLGIE